ncbi:uncharacterized protein LOC143470864 isoform X2 [Clavelina lepadiformis]|uniref:uncharacterized protein LOC143470864 isoform X2 n=1 Tax=Clavelina lepadiformis TaxID=159417 RepID=UPI0040439020
MNPEETGGGAHSDEEEESEKDETSATEIVETTEPQETEQALPETEETAETSNVPPTITDDENGGQSNTTSAEDEIGVCLDYQPPPHIEHDNQSIATDSNVIRTNRSSRNRQRTRRQRRNDVGFIRFYTKHWLGQCISGFFTGLVFFSIGIVFVVHFDQLPNYIGILFILVSFPPCCMALNRYRYARRTYDRRSRSRNRMSALRRMRGGDDDGAHRNGELPYSDQPPAYDNLGYVGQDLEVVDESAPPSRSSSFISDIAPPAYVDALKLKKLKEEEVYRQNNNNNNNNSPSSPSGSRANAEHESSVDREFPLPNAPPG